MPLNTTAMEEEVICGITRGASNIQQGQNATTDNQGGFKNMI